MNTLNRRDFLKLAGLVFASGTVLSAHQTLARGVQLFADPQIRFGKSLLRGTAYGAILSSLDEGMTWTEVARFGEHHAVMQLVERNKQVYANLSFDSHDFWLRSADAQKWLTV